MNISDKDETYETETAGEALEMQKDEINLRPEKDECKEMTKQQMWERKLLDLSLRNSLLNFRATKNSVQLMVSDIISLEDKLSSGEEFSLMPHPEDSTNADGTGSIIDTRADNELITAIADPELKNKRIRTFLTSSELEKRSKALYRTARLSIEENGSNTLYLALGFLKWYENDKSDKARYAPLVLVPIDIVRDLQNRTYKIRIRDEETQMNITLLELLRQDHGLVINGLDPIPTDESGADISLIFDIIRQAVINEKRWSVESYAFVGLFSFSRFIMWNDIRNRSEDLVKNKVVSSLISGKMEWQRIEDTPDAEELDEMIRPADLAIPSSADSSQLIAVYQAAKGQSFVLHGPPGTGKSQTITNMIANALYHDKTVLFVAEKMAALSVVQSRLEKIGLGAFCLELHSNKAQKRAVLSQLERTMEIGRIKAPEQYSETADKLYAIRKELNDVMHAIHKKRYGGISVYEAVTTFETYSDHKGKIELSEHQIASLSAEMLEQWKNAVLRLKSAANEFGDISRHTLKSYGRRDYSIAVRDEFSSKTSHGEELLKSFNRAYTKLTGSLNTAPAPDMTKCLDLAQLCDILLCNSVLISDILSSKLDTQRLDYIRSLIASGKEYSRITEEITEVFDNTVFGLDAVNAKLSWKKALSSWFAVKNIGQNKLLKAIKLHAKDPDKVSKDNYLEIVDKLIRRNDLHNMISSADAISTQSIKEVWMSESTNWELAEKALNDSIYAAKILETYSISYDRYISLKSDAESIAHEYAACFDSLARFDEDFCRIFNVETHNDCWLDECGKRYGEWQLYTDRIREWSQLLCELDNVDASGIPQVSEAMKSGAVSSDDVYESFMCAVSYAAAISAIRSDPCLSQFSSRAFEDCIERFAEVSEQFRALTINELVAKLSSKIPSVSGEMAGSSEIGILLKTIKNGGRMMPIRKLFDSIPLLLHRICPCMLMSPISVAQYIDPSFPKFDLVIFDEASQMPTCEAVGAIARGENVVVVGDPKQLPPTSFFAVNHYDEENYEIEDLESVLDDCLAISMPQEHLLWHYRSRHESLIAFSNSRYYDNKLYTFPSPNDLESKVTFVKVDGYYDKGSTKQNRAEAEAIVAEIERRLDDPELRLESIGVVAFSVAQQTVIDDMLADKFRERPELEQFAEQLYEPLFVKNLENVQGDERDVILFSIGYGPDKEGKLSMNFGPINRDGGWRRLNVAISRARKSMTVYSTITYDMIDMSRTSSEGVAGLKGFLEYAQIGRSALAVRTADDTSKNGIEKLIAQHINDAGYATKCNIGCSEYKIDIGVIDPDDPSRYILGIMCDGDSYVMAKTASDRNISQPEVLKGLGWNLCRIWSVDWFDDKQKVINKILSAISEAIETKGSGNAANNRQQIVSELVFDKETADDANYSRIRRFLPVDDIHIGTSSDFYLAEYKQRICSLMQDIIVKHAPVSRKTLFKTVLAAFGMSRSTSKSDEYLAELLDALSCIVTKSNNSAFVWSEKITPENFDYFRVAENEKRQIDDICSQEIANAVIYVLEKQLTLTRADLTREVAKCFGYSRTTAAMDRSITEGILLCKSRGAICISSDTGKISLC